MKTLSNIHNIKNKPWMDYSSMSTFMRCPRQYWWSCVQNIQPAGPQLHFIVGEACHEAKATFYDKLHEGANLNQAKIAGLLKLKELMAGIPSEDPARNLTNCTIIMNNYFDMWHNDGYKTIETEVKFALDLERFYFVGRVDRVMESNFGIMVEETKTTTVVGTQWQNRLKPNLQIDGYYSMLSIITGQFPFGAVLDVIPIKDKPDKYKPFRFITTRGEEDVEDWLITVQDWYDNIQRCKERNHFPKNTEVCTPLIGFKCAYPILCEKYPNPFKVQDIEIPEAFEKREWIPFEELRKLG